MSELYLLLSISLIASYLAFRLGSEIAYRLNPQSSFRTWLRWGQFLLVLSLVTPLVVRATPSRLVSQLSLTVLAPLWEGVVGEAVETAKPAEPVARLTSAPEPSRLSVGFRQWVSRLSAIGWAGLPYAVLLGILIALVVRMRQAVRLCALLQRGILIRRSGRVTIIASSEIPVPISTLLGGRAWVVVPESLVVNWRDFKLAVKHELQHHRQKDTAWAIGIDLFTAFFFLNPFAYLWKRRINEIQELSCDEALIGRKVSSYEYGSCLVRVAETALENCEGLVGTTSMAAGFENPAYFKSFLKRRIDMLLVHSQRRPSRLAGFAIGTVAMLSTFVFAFGAEHVFGNRSSGGINPGLVVTDPEIQNIADKALDAALKRHGASLGFVIVSDPVTGRLLAVANKDTGPSKTDRTPHWALSMRVGPASLSKAIVAAAAVEKGLTSFAEKHNCEKGTYEWGGRVYRDWQPFKQLSTADTVIHSSNVCGMKVGQKLGAEALSALWKDFGFGPGGTAAAVPEARVGDVPDPASSDDIAYVADVSTGLGGLHVTPIEVVQAFGAIANGGNLLRPLTGVADGNTPRVVRRLLSEHTAKETREVLAQVLVRGTARNAASKMYRLAGKTATGYSENNPRIEGRNLIPNLAGFAGFAPAENPRVVIYVGVENPTDREGVHGAYHAAPVFREVAEKTLQYMKVPTNN